MICAIENSDTEPIKNWVYKWHSILSHRDSQIVKHCHQAISSTVFILTNVAKIATTS